MVTILMSVVSAKAAEVDLVLPFSDFGLREPQNPPPHGKALIYSTTGPAFQWEISQWDIAGGRLSPFVGRREGDAVTYAAQSRAASIEVTRNPQTTELQLGQDGAVTPCLTAAGLPREADLFFSSRLVAGRSAISPVARASVGALTALSALHAAAQITFHAAPTAVDKGCAVNKGGAVIALILSNPAAHPAQTLFYQIALGGFCREDLPHAQCRPPARQLNAFYKKNPFGMDDNLGLLGQKLIASGETRLLDIDLLPRLRAAIGAGPEAMDHDPSHWHVTGAYAGQIIWGDVVVRSEWKNYRLIAVTP